MSTQKVVGFWKAEEVPYGYMCQWYPCQFEENGITYPNTECYMMYRKALLFNDEATGAKILKASTPKQMKDLGRKVKNFNQDIWDQEKYQIVVQGNTLKFNQNPALKEKLLRTGDATLAELSPIDSIWGCGTTNPSPKAWTGQNLLGKALMEVRGKLQ